MSIRVLIADDDPLIREALEIVIKRDEAFKLVASVKDGRSAVEECCFGRVDVAVLDIRMPLLNGVEATLKIKQDSTAKVLILSTFSEDEFIQKALDYGASGYILKGTAIEDIKRAIQMVDQGQMVFQDEVFNKFSRNEKKGNLSMLTEREQEVVIAVSEGLSNKEIGEKIFLSEGTIKNHITSILSKLNLKQRTQIAVYYLTNKTFNPGK